MSTDLAFSRDAQYPEPAPTWPSVEHRSVVVSVALGLLGTEFRGGHVLLRNAIRNSRGTTSELEDLRASSGDIPRNSSWASSCPHFAGVKRVHKMNRTLSPCYHYRQLCTLNPFHYEPSYLLGSLGSSRPYEICQEPPAGAAGSPVLPGPQLSAHSWALGLGLYGFSGGRPLSQASFQLEGAWPR